jgi:hypothetical protein
MATSIAGYRGRNWTDRLSAFPSLYSVRFATNSNFTFSISAVDCIELSFIILTLETSVKIIARKDEGKRVIGIKCVEGMIALGQFHLRTLQQFSK